MKKVLGLSLGWLAMLMASTVAWAQGTEDTPYWRHASSVFFSETEALISCNDSIPKPLALTLECGTTPNPDRPLNGGLQGVVHKRAFYW